MTNEERDIISRFVARVGGAAPGGFGGSVPGTQQAAALPPMDAEADRFIADQFAQHPEARYRITQMAFVQEAALVEAQNRIRRLEWEVQQHQAAAPAQAQQPSRGFFGNLFGGGQPQGQGQGQPSYGQPQYGQPQYGQAQPQAQYQQQPPPAQYPPGYQPGMLQRGGGSGFLGSALTTAAGVAGGMVAGNALMGLFSGHEGGGGFGGGFGGGGGQTINETVNNYGNAGVQPDPWGGAGVADPNAGGFAQPDPGGTADEGGAFDQGTADPGFDQGGTDPSFGGGGFDDNSGGGGDTWT